MVYFIFITFFCLVGGLAVVACNPSPYFGAAGLVLSSVAACTVVVEFGGSFVSLILFLIYLGGMLVVFAYSVALASDPFPEGIWDMSVGAYFTGYLVFLVGFLAVFGGDSFFYNFGVIGSEASGFNVVRGDFEGVSLLYGLGGAGLVICGWGLLLTLFVVLELTRGMSRGGLRVI
ncbi:NADH dehydrogenase subunit 6 (mitochondrion) [Anolis carolinensis]|uniref:NADH-ubiquinone oxidoreductase chain 6 n=1 Tax=Anolis carolinensis TaxID=28377 RepID=B3GT01_ANOCA|nr:NADH dehydrogenase subunit 6 [Anolis carolinensis]|eukprot:YP_001974681.2 NADH dehydrogenase subunit 6 (mitochondrion) [Anolis carolinensis]